MYSVSIQFIPFQVPQYQYPSHTYLCFLQPDRLLYPFTMVSTFIVYVHFPCKHHSLPLSQYSCCYTVPLQLQCLVTCVGMIWNTFGAHAQYRFRYYLKLILRNLTMAKSILRMPGMSTYSDRLREHSYYYFIIKTAKTFQLLALVVTSLTQSG